MRRCKGRNCTSSNGSPHSRECEQDLADALDPHRDRRVGMTDGEKVRAVWVWDVLAFMAAGLTASAVGYDGIYGFFIACGCSVGAHELASMYYRNFR